MMNALVLPTRPVHNIASLVDCEHRLSISIGDQCERDADKVRKRVRFDLEVLRAQWADFCAHSRKYVPLHFEWRRLPRTVTYRQSLLFRVHEITLSHQGTSGRIVFQYPLTDPKQQDVWIPRSIFSPGRLLYFDIVSEIAQKIYGESRLLHVHDLQQNIDVESTRSETVILVSDDDCSSIQTTSL